LTLSLRKGYAYCMADRGKILVALSLVLASAGAGRTVSAETWAIQFVDVGSNSGQSTSLGLVNGYPVISYFGSPRNLKYAALSPVDKKWILQTVDAGGEFTSLAVDSSGIVHVGYLNGFTMQLKYWRNNQGQTTIQVIDSEPGQGGMGFYNSIQVDASGTPHISYYHTRDPAGGITDDLKYAVLNGSTWSTAFIDRFAERGKYNSLALDAMGNPQIAYFDNVGTLRLAKQVAGIWTTQGIDSTGDSGRFNSIRIDALGRPHISYIAAAPVVLRYAYFDGALWHYEDVDGVGAVVAPSVTSLALDASGNAHISYYDAASTSLKYASRIGGVWTVQTVDSVGDVGGYSSLRLDAQARPIISYFDATTAALKIAYGDYPDQDADGIPDVFDSCPSNPDCNSNGIVDGREGGVPQGTKQGVRRLGDESIFGCGSLSALHGASGPPGGGPPPTDLLLLLAPAFYLMFRKCLGRPAGRRPC